MFVLCAFVFGKQSYLLFLSCHSAPNGKQTNLGEVNMLLLLKRFMHVRIWGQVIKRAYCM